MTDFGEVGWNMSIYSYSEDRHCLVGGKFGSKIGLLLSASTLEDLLNSKNNAIETLNEYLNTRIIQPPSA